MTASVGEESNLNYKSEAKYVFGDKGLERMESKIEALSHTVQGTYEHNADGNLTYIHEIINRDQPYNISYLDKTITCSYDEKGRIHSQTTVHKGSEDYLLQQEMVFTYEDDSFDVKRIDILESDYHMQFDYQYENDRLKKMTIIGEDGVTTLTYSYDAAGRIIKKEYDGEGFHETIEFEHKVVKDPVIASFLRLKTDYLTHEDNNYSLFVLQSDENLWNEHYCYNCGRLLPFAYQTCPYCGTKVNRTVYYESADVNLPPTVGMANIWSVDGDLIYG